MFGSINDAIQKQKKRENENQELIENAIGVEEILPGSEDEYDDVVDPDSVPEEVFKKIDDQIDKMLDDPEYDDTEAEELADDEELLDEEDEAEIDALITEAVDDSGNWVDPENIGHPDVDRRDPEDEQPEFGDGDVCPKCGKDPCECDCDD